MRAEPQPHWTCTKNFVKCRRVVFEIASRHTQIHANRSTSRLYRRRSDESLFSFGPTAANPSLQVCCCEPGGQETSIDCCTARARQQRRSNADSATVRPAKSHASRVRLTHFRWVSRSHSAQWKSHAFSCSTKNNIFNVTRVLLLWWEMRILTPVLLLLTLGLLIFICFCSNWFNAEFDLFGSTTRM